MVIVTVMAAIVKTIIKAVVLLSPSYSIVTRHHYCCQSGCVPSLRPVGDHGSEAGDASYCCGAAMDCAGNGDYGGRRSLLPYYYLLNVDARYYNY